MSCPSRLQLLIADAEPAARWQLRRLVADCASPPCEVVAEAASAAEALHQLERHRIDGMLLDARLWSPAAGASATAAAGQALVRGLRERADAPPLVVLAHEPAQALQAFEVEAVDCLLRPVRPVRLHQALERLARRVHPPGLPPGLPGGARPGWATVEEAACLAPSLLWPAAWLGLPSAALPGLDDPAAVLRVRAQQRLLHLPLAELRYLRASHKCVTVRTRERSYVVDDALHDLAERLGEAALRIHRNALVLRAAVRSLERRPGRTPQQLTWGVQLADVPQWLEVSRRRVARVRQALGLA